MRQRLQIVNGDAVLEITEESTVKRRLSEKGLLRAKENLETTIARAQASLAEVKRALTRINNAKTETPAQ